MGYYGSYGGSYYGSYFGQAGPALPHDTRGIGTFTDTVALALRQRIIDSNIADADYVYLALDEEVESPPCDLFVVLVIGPQRPEQAIVTGAAAETITPIAGQFGVILWKRLDTDVNGRDTNRLTNSTLGLLRTQRRLLRCLQQYDPLDVRDNFLLTEPCRLDNAGFDCRPKRHREGWAWVANVIEAKYNADMVSDEITISQLRLDDGANDALLLED